MFKEFSLIVRLNVLNEQNGVLKNESGTYLTVHVKIFEKESGEYVIMQFTVQQKGELNMACWLQLLIKIKLFYVYTS